VYDVYDDEGILIDRKPVWEIKEYRVEDDGAFIWPRTVRNDNKAFGFDKQILARIQAEYSDRVQFYAQYYNDPNDPDSNRIETNKFQYYNPRFLKKEGGRWFFNSKRLNIYAAVDFAFSLNRDADFTAIVVIGLDGEGNYYVLDIDRFKSKKTIEYFEHLAELHSKWKFQKLRAEVTVAQAVIVDGIKDYVKQHGLTISIDEYRPSKAEGNKEQRIASALEHLYDGQRMWHYEGGWTKVLEEELVLARPAHDDIKDALASAVTIAVKPASSKSTTVADFLTTRMNKGRFGGVAFK
jgi:predicted phage terminase large subunit-like protein